MKKSITALALAMAVAAFVPTLAFAEDDTEYAAEETTVQENTEDNDDWTKWLDPEYYKSGQMLEDIGGYDWKQWLDYDWTQWLDKSNYDWTQWLDKSNYDWTRWIR